MEAAQREKNRLLLRKPYRDMEIWDTLARHLGVRLLRDDEQAKAAAAGEDELDIAQLMISDHKHKMGKCLCCMA